MKLRRTIPSADATTGTTDGTTAAIAPLAELVSGVDAGAEPGTSGRRPSRSERRAATRTAQADAAAATAAAAAFSDTEEAVSWWRAHTSIGQTVKPPAVMAFSRQLSSFLEAGISILEALEIVEQQTASKTMRTVIARINSSIQRGSSFADAIAASPDVFPSYYRSMLVSAEYTGHLDVVLAQLAAYLERDIEAKRQVKSALTYPILVLFVACAAMVVMSVFVLPKFSGLYRSLGAKLPLPTKLLLGFTDFITTKWPFIVAALALLVVGWRLIAGGERGKPRRDLIAMRVPVIGNLFHLISLERFCRVLSALASAGVPLPEAIGVSADSTNNSIFQAKLQVVQDTLIRGGGLYDPMLESGIFPVAARQMIQVGERTGSLDHQLAKAATYYEREVSFEMKRATDLFEPTVILFVGLIVGFVAVAQVAAMYSIFGQLK